MRVKYDGSQIISEGVDKQVPWWSFTKTLLSTCALVLVEKEKLQLGKKYLFLDATLGQLLRHEAGYGDYTGLDAYRSLVTMGEEPWKGDEMIERAHGMKQGFKPGSGWRYSNVGYYYVRLIIEEACGMRIDDVINELIFSKLEIDAFIALTREDLKGVEMIDSHYHPGYVYHSLAVGSVSDAVRVLHAIASGEILSQASIDMMRSCYDLTFDIGDRPWAKPGYGYGVMINHVDDKDYAYGHTGQGPGSVIAVYHYPNRRTPTTVGVIRATHDQGMVEWELVNFLDA